MPNYRRMRVDGGCWFFTVNLLDRRQTLLTDHIGVLREAVTRTQRARPFTINTFVVLPDHLHTIWTLPAGDTDFSGRWRSIKIQFTKSMSPLAPPSGIRTARGERGIWQRRFWEHMIRDERDYENHVNYCYINPVKHGLVTRVADWPYSSFHRDVRAGMSERLGGRCETQRSLRRAMRRCAVGRMRRSRHPPAGLGAKDGG